MGCEKEGGIGSAEVTGLGANALIRDKKKWGSRLQVNALVRVGWVGLITPKWQYCKTERHILPCATCLLHVGWGLCSMSLSSPQGPGLQAHVYAFTFVETRERIR